MLRSIGGWKWFGIYFWVQESWSELQECSGSAQILLFQHVCSPPQNLRTRIRSHLGNLFGTRRLCVEQFYATVDLRCWGPQDSTGALLEKSRLISKSLD